MELDRKELKRRAREAMRLTQPHFWLVALVYFFMTTGLTYLVSDLAPAMGSAAGVFSTSLFLSLALGLYNMVMDFSYSLWSLWTYRKLDPGLGSLMQGFSVATKVITMRLVVYFWVVMRSMLFTLILMIPLMVLLPDSMFSIILVLIVPVSTLFTWVAELYFGLAPFLLADNPDAPVRTIVHRSETLMKGWKWSLAKLEFSFVGWYILKYLLTLLAQVFMLWQGGFLEALLSFRVDQLPAIVSGLSYWLNGLMPEAAPFTQAQTALYELYYTLSNGPLTLILGYLFSLPVFLWLTPYINVCRAGFYDARLQHQMEQAPEL